MKSQNRLSRTLMGICGITLSLVCFATEPNATPNPDLSTTMKKNFDALVKLQPFIAKPERFRDPGNNDEIQKLLDSLTGLKHVFPQKMAEQEPGLAAISTLFSSYLQDIQETFRSGHKDFARLRLRTMTGFCLNCHTRVATDRNFTDIEKKVQEADLTPFQKAEFFAATRQFDKALEAFGTILNSVPTNEPGMIEFTHAVKNALSITVRVKQDPKHTFFLLEKLNQRKDLPEFFQRQLKIWKQDVAQWNKERALPKNTSGETYMAHASKLVKQAQKLQLYPADHSGDISYLRATNMIHEALSRNPKAKYRADALYLLGVAYEALQDPLLWALDELYFESCIREFPHTQTSKRCYQRFSSKVYWGYTGSAGTSIPNDEAEKLRELRKLSE